MSRPWITQEFYFDATDALHVPGSPIRELFRGISACNTVWARHISAQALQPSDTYVHSLCFPPFSLHCRETSNCSCMCGTCIVHFPYLTTWVSRYETEAVSTGLHSATTVRLKRMWLKWSRSLALVQLKSLLMQLCPRQSSGKKSWTWADIPMVTLRAGFFPCSSERSVQLPPRTEALPGLTLQHLTNIKACCSTSVAVLWVSHSILH